LNFFDSSKIKLITYYKEYNMKEIIFCAITVVALSACAGTKNEKVEYTAEQKQQAGYECEKVTITGSKMPRKMCTTAAKRLEIERKAQETLRNSTRGGTGSDG
jgi:hypothetical protein